jgi:hypothetical protein
LIIAEFLQGFSNDHQYEEAKELMGSLEYYGFVGKELAIKAIENFRNDRDFNPFELTGLAVPWVMTMRFSGHFRQCSRIILRSSSVMSRLSIIIRVLKSPKNGYGEGHAGPFKSGRNHNWQEWKTGVEYVGCKRR